MGVEYTYYVYNFICTNTMNYTKILDTFTTMNVWEKTQKLLDLAALLAPHNQKLEEIIPLIQSHTLSEQQIDTLYTKLIGILASLQTEQLADADAHITALQEQLRILQETEKVQHSKDQADADALIQWL